MGSATWAEIAGAQFRLLTFRSAGDIWVRGRQRAMIWGFMTTWLAGVGRYWDHPDAWWWQYAGLGSVVYVFVLAGIITALVKPLCVGRFEYRDVLLFLTLTSLPALLYATPVERFLHVDTALAANVWFLAVVAIWRVGLYMAFLGSYARLRGFRLIVATMSPLVAVIVVLSVLNLEQAVFNIMAGIGGARTEGRDAQYGFTVLLALYSVLASPVLLMAWLGGVFQAHKLRMLALAESEPPWEGAAASEAEPATSGQPEQPLSSDAQA
jgi:hypothetical protein